MLIIRNKEVVMTMVRMVQVGTKINPNPTPKRVNRTEKRKKVKIQFLRPIRQ